MPEAVFRSSFCENIFHAKYGRDVGGPSTWAEMADNLATTICGDLLDAETVNKIREMILEMKFIPGGRYLYYAGGKRSFLAINNCFLLRGEEDTREEWGALLNRSVSCLMTGGGIGVDYSVFRPAGALLARTGGTSSGPIPLMEMVNESGRRVMQGGSRRSAIYASLNWQHADIPDFLHIKDWDAQIFPGGPTYGECKKQNFNFPCPLDMTNISVNYDDAWLNKTDRHLDPVFVENCKQALRNGEPGFSFNFGSKQLDTLRNACCELTSEDDSDVCNLGSLNMSRITDIADFMRCTTLATAFLLCGTIKGDLPYEKVYRVRDKNRRLGLGLMGVHEWLLARGQRYECTPELHEWLRVYRDGSNFAAGVFAKRLGVNLPAGIRAIAPTGTIGILAGTTTGIEPVFAVAYRRRYLKAREYHYEYVVDAAAEAVIQASGCGPADIESALDLAKDFERRIKFQADVQEYVDHAISSTINLPSWGSEYNNEGTVGKFAETLSQYAPQIRGFTCYPDGARGGQPLEAVPYEEAMQRRGTTYKEQAADICEISGGGTCGI